MQDSAIELFNQSNHRIYDGEFWNVIMSYNQAYLGRCIVYLKSRSIADTLTLTEEEHKELWNDILPRLAKAIHTAFSPDRINYAHLANSEKHVHWHIVPRYDNEKEFLGEKFTDDAPNKNFKSGEKDLSSDQLDAIYREIMKNFNE